MIKPFKYIAVSLAILPLATACSEADEPAVKADPARYITFAAPAIDMEATVGGFASGRAASRADVLATSVENFKVWGFCKACDLSGNPSASTMKSDWNQKANFFTKGADVNNLIGATVTVKDGYTSYGDLTSWDLDVAAQYSFIAVSGLDLANSSMAPGSISQTNPHGPLLTVTLPITVNDTTVIRKPDAQKDVMVAWTFDHNRVDGRVPLDFMHIMTGIRFKFHNHSEDVLTIKRVTYRGRFFKQAVFHFDNTNPYMTVPTDQTYACKFELLNENMTIPRTTEDGTTPEVYMGGDASPVTLLLLPNPSGTTAVDEEYTLGREKEIVITYERAGSPGEKTFKLSNFTLNYTPKPNTLHTAHFNFVGDRFLVMFEADNKLNWEDGSNSNITIH